MYLIKKGSFDKLLFLRGKNLKGKALYKLEVETLNLSQLNFFIRDLSTRPIKIVLKTLL
jgi:hypothetical protein